MAVYTEIDDAGLFFNTKLYIGTGSSNAITGVGFQPDVTWIKGRTTTYQHVLTDSIRGVTKELYPNANSAAVTNVNGLTAFGADGFTVGTDAGYNGSTNTMVSWNWKAGTTTGIAGSPSITPTSYSFNATSGFSMVAYTGAYVAGDTIPHGLGVAPKFGIFKSRDAVHGWQIYHANGMGNTNTMYLDGTWASGASATYFNDTSPTSTLMSMGNGTDINESGTDYIAYMFAEVQGYSKFGSYRGNGNADGPFVYTGFRPAYFLIKCSSSTGSWMIFDAKRLGYNPDNNNLIADSTSDSGTTDYVDILSNGFKFRSSDSTVNATNTYIYAAFAEAPFVNSNGVPSNAR